MASLQGQPHDLHAVGPAGKGWACGHLAGRGIAAMAGAEVAVICVFRGAGPTDAFLLAHWLERHEIPVHVRGDLVGLQGQIPLGDAWPSVWVAEEFGERAAVLIKRFEGPQLVQPAWTCTSCGEANEPTFDSCWSCQADRDWR